MLFDEITREGRLYKDPRLDFKDTRSLLINNELYTLKDGNPVTAYKYGNFTDAQKMVMTTLENLPLNENLHSFSVANLANKSIILTGGGDSDMVSAKTFMMEILTGKWQK